MFMQKLQHNRTIYYIAQCGEPYYCDLHRVFFHIAIIAKLVYKTLIVEKSLDEIISETKFPIGKLLGILTNLEIKKLVKAIAGGKYRKI
jgi:predicted Rossmann fold nucleotide-binding protein DprA/Smf involved in DNA uptake